MNDSDIEIIARLVTESFELGYDEGYGMRSLERTGTWRTLGETTNDNE